MATLVDQLLIKLGLRDEPNMLEKTNELVRILELRSTNVPLQINEYGKVVICADIAASLMGVPFDKEQAMKLSAQRKSHYVNNRRMFEKLLDVNKLVGVNDICLQLGLSQVNKKADQLLDLYRKVAASEQSTEVDVSHPQYAAMAVFMACKLCKEKVSKPKLIPFSNLKPSQWQQLEKRWDKFMAKYSEEMKKNLAQKNFDNQEVASIGDNALKSNTGIKVRTEVEDYEKWKKRMLDMAQSRLEEQKYDSESLKEEYPDLDFTEVIDNILGF